MTLYRNLYTRWYENWSNTQPEMGMKMHKVIATGKAPLKWKGKFYTIVKAGILSTGKAYAVTEPREPESQEELNRRMDKDKHLHIL